MSIRAAAAVVVLLLGCAGGTQGKYSRKVKTEATAELIRELLEFTANRNNRGLAHMLSTPLGYGGVWFPDTTCRRKFIGAGVIPESGVDLFASCLAALPLALGDRTHSYPDVAVFTYPPGIEIEVLFDPADGGHVKWLGFAGRRDIKDALPTVTQAALLELRNEVAPLVIDDATRAEIDNEMAGHAPDDTDGVHAWFKVCIDATGAVSGVHPRLTSSVVAQDALAVWIRTWSFRSFKLGDQPSPVCSLIHLALPDGTPRGASVMPPPVPPELATATVVTEAALGPLLEGERTPAPDQSTLSELRDGDGSATALVMYCVGDIGKVDTAVLMRSSGVMKLDKLVVKATETWRFAPFTVRANPVRVCTHHAFKYAATVPQVGR